MFWDKFIINFEIELIWDRRVRFIWYSKLKNNELGLTASMMARFTFYHRSEIDNTNIIDLTYYLTY